jgi:hypothetical protein
MKKIILAASVLALTFTACKKEVTTDPTNPTKPDNSSRLLKKMTKSEAGQTTVYNLTYDGAKRLSQIKSADNHELIEFFYDNNGNVVKMEQREDNESRNLFTFSYNNGIPVSGTFKSWELTEGEPEELTEDDVLTYTVTNNQVTKINQNFLLQDVAVDFLLTYANGNLAKAEATGIPNFNYSATFAYGDKKSPFPKVFKHVLDPAGLSVQFFTKNDIKSMTLHIPGTTTQTTTTTYTYDAAGYPLTSNDGTTTHTFEYQ